MYKVEEPLNSNERYLYGINVRLEILINMFSSFLDAYAYEKGFATTSNTLDTSVEVPKSEEIIEEPVYATLTKTKIMEILDEKGIEYKSTMLKAELLELLKE